MDIETRNPLPDIEIYDADRNPLLISNKSTYGIQFYLTKESILDVEEYRSFLKNVERRVRSSVTYTHYKGFLMGLGLNHCQVHGYINEEMATLEMHHAILTLFDICFMVTEHLLNTVGYVTSYDVVQIVKDEHKLHDIALTMLSKTPHQIYHSDDSFLIHPDMCIGNWPNFINKFITGLNQDLSFKLLYYIKRAIEVGTSDDSGLLKLRDSIIDWSKYNGNN